MRQSVPVARTAQRVKLWEIEGKRAGNVPATSSSLVSSPPYMRWFSSHSSGVTRTLNMRDVVAGDFGSSAMLVIPAEA